MWGYQDYEFEVTELQGERLQSLVLFGTPNDAQKLLGRLAGGGAFHAYMSAFIGFCHELDAEGVRVVSESYEDMESMNIAEVLGLHDQPPQRAQCALTTVPKSWSLRSASTSIAMRITG